MGGDIIENKKTFLYLTALKRLDPAQSIQLQHLFSIDPQDPSEKVETVKQLFIESGASEAIQKEIENYTHQALKVLDELEVKEENKENLREFARALMYRSV